MADHLEEALGAVTSNPQLKKDRAMTVLNKLANTMKASGDFAYSAQSQLKP